MIKFILGISFILFTIQCSTYRFEDLKRYENSRNADRVIQFLDEKTDPYVRAQAAQSIGRMNIKKAMPQLIFALESKDWIVRYYAAQSIIKLGVPEKYRQNLTQKVQQEKNEYVRVQLKKILQSFKVQELLSDDGK